MHLTINRYFYWIFGLGFRPLTAAVRSRTLIFCTSYADSIGVWDTRYYRWIAGVSALEIEGATILIVDDASPVLPCWQQFQVYQEALSPQIISFESSKVIYQFSERLGKVADSNFPGWYRSFSYALQIAVVQRFDKVIHIESDAFIVSQRLKDYLTYLSTGWTALWCPRHGFPEIGIQIIGSDAIGDAASFFSAPYSSLIGKVMESEVPFTTVEKSFVGDRYGEFRKSVPKKVDYANQVPLTWPSKKLWWINPSKFLVSSVREMLSSLHFGATGNARASMESGWSYTEHEGTWMEGRVSTIAIDSIQGNIKSCRLILQIRPFIVLPQLTSQRLYVELNGRSCGQYIIYELMLLEIGIDTSVIRLDAGVTIRLVHLDANSPNNFGIGEDKRELSFFTSRLWIDGIR